MYNIPGVKDFVLAEIIGGSAKEDDTFERIENKYPKYNFGQYIAAKGNRLKVMGRVEGDSLGLKDWGPNAAKITDTNALIPQDEAKAFLDGLQEIEKFPLSSYIDLAEQFKYLSEKNTRVDCVNPNNILIDRNSKRFHHIDLPFRQFLYTDFKRPLNTVDDMIAVLCDFTLHTTYLNSLNEADAEALANTTKNIILKCGQAAQIAGLDQDEENLVRNLKMKDNAREGTDLPKYHFLKHYFEFKHLYKSALSEL